jgi:hypothetical protein
MTPAEIIELGFKLVGLVGGALALAYYGGQFTRSIRSIDENVRAMNERLEKLTDIQHAHGERIAGVEARQAANR